MTSSVSAEIREPASGRSSGFVTTSTRREHDHPFRLLVIRWDMQGSAAEAPETSRALRLVGALLERGTRVVIATEASLDALLPAIDTSIEREHRRRLHAATDAGKHVFGFDHRGKPIELAPLSGEDDVIAYMIRELAQPLGIEPEDVLVVDEALGPDGIAAILGQQLDVEAQMGPFAPPRDPSWVIVESGFDVAREHEIESLLTIANGYLGVRGSIPEGSSVSRPATFLAGAFEPSSDVSPVPELVIAPDWGRLRFTVEGEPFAVETTFMERHHRTLDMRRGLLLREGLGTGPAGHATRIRTAHLASLSNRHLLLEAVEITPQNFSGVVLVDAVLSGDVKSGSGSSHWAGFEPRNGLVGPILVGKTHGGLELALASRTTSADPGTIEMRCDRQLGPVSAMERCTLRVRLGEPSVLHRVVGLFTSRDGTTPVQRVELLEREAAATSFEALLGDHVAAWQARWKRSDVEIDGAPGIERALRFALYHLIATVHPDDPRCSIGARALSGEAYRGHVFWDTEIFMVPFYVHTWPEAARTLLLYRHLTIDGARRKAKKLGYEGALYAWESADTGDETTPEFVRSPIGEVIPILSGFEEHHISADVAYAIWEYAQTTGDTRILREEGAEILVETARFWVSRGSIKADGKFHIDKVIGPDEYHETVDDNAFTNWMARKNLLYAIAVARGEGREKAAALGVTEEEITRWEEVAARMYLAVDPRTGILEQHKGYFGLEYIDVAAYSPRTVPIDVLLGRERTRKSQVVKQADVVQLMALLWDQFSPAARRENFLYYEPRTAHGSSLSPGIHALVAARLGLLETATRYLEQTAAIDLGNNMGNAAGGVHAAGLGSLWQAVVFGVAGLRAAPEDPETLIVEPTLLPGMRRVSVPMELRGRSLMVHALRGAVEVHVVEGQAPIGLMVSGQGGAIHTVRAEPGRAYAARREQDGFLAWEEIEP